MGNAIDICLATFNGGLYLKEQLDSIIEQTFSDWHLYIRDDGSSDNTFNILIDYKSRFPDKITLILDKKGCLGFAQNFNEITKYTKAPIISFSDQDDVWNCDKLQKHYEILKNANEEGILVHSNLIYINEFGTFIKKSLLDENKERPDILNKNIIRGLYWGYAVGCTVSMSRKLLLICGEIPKSFPTGHDHWYLYGAILFGQTKYIEEVYVKHRIHLKNASNKYIVKKKQLNVNSIKKAINMANCLSEVYNDNLSSTNYRLLEQQKKFDTFNLVNRLNFYFASGLFSFHCFKRSFILLIKFTLFTLIHPQQQR